MQFPKILWKTASLAAVSVVLAVAAQAQQKNDIVKLKSGAEESGRIKSEEYGGLVLDPEKGNSKTIAWGEVASVSYQNGEGYEAARDLVNQGKLEEALGEFQDLLKPEAKLRSLVKQNVQFQMGTLLLRTGKYDDSISAYKALLKDFPKSRFLPEIGENFVLAYGAKGDLEGAKKALEELNTGAVAAGVESNFSAVTAVLRGRVLEQQKKWSEAFSAYNAAAATSGVTALASAQARLGQGRCQIAQGKSSEAETLFRKITGEDAPNAVLAGAWNGLADLTKADGRAKKDAGILTDALYMYLRGIVQYGPIPGESTGEYERAMAGAAECFDLLSQVEGNKEIKARYARSRDERRAQLQKEFPNSPYLGK
jgi:tetratricopeptide (TPR) repeat protein